MDTAAWKSRRPMARFGMFYWLCGRVIPAYGIVWRTNRARSVSISISSLATKTCGIWKGWRRRSRTRPKSRSCPLSAGERLSERFQILLVVVEMGRHSQVSAPGCHQHSLLLQRARQRRKNAIFEPRRDDRRTELLHAAAQLAQDVT